MTDTVTLMFSYSEHEWSEQVDGFEEAVVALMSHVAEAEWAPHTGTGHDPDEFATIEELEQRARESVEAWGVPEDVVRIPIAKLRAIIDEGGWTFVAGVFYEAEPNHNDTEYIVKLTR